MPSVTDFISYSRSQIGKPYILGAIGPDAYDCSGLIFAACRDVFALELPRQSTFQYGIGIKVKWEDLQPGDLVFFDTGWTNRKPNHLGIVTAPGKMINASSFQNGVREESFSQYWKSKFYGGRRFIDLISPFADIKITDIYFSFIHDLLDRGAVAGYPPDSEGKILFRPNASVNRAEMLKIICLAAGISVETAEVSPFNDVKKSDWYFDYVITLSNAGIIEGYPDGSFKPGAFVNRVEALKIILTALKMADIFLETSPYSDVKKDDWFYKYAGYCSDKYLLPPDAANRLLPNLPMSRGEVCMVISKVLQFR